MSQEARARRGRRWLARLAGARSQRMSLATKFESKYWVGQKVHSYFGLITPFLPHKQPDEGILLSPFYS